jgi:hypothetical protein
MTTTDSAGAITGCRGRAESAWFDPRRRDHTFLDGVER